MERMPELNLTALYMSRDLCRSEGNTKVIHNNKYMIKISYLLKKDTYYSNSIHAFLKIMVFLFIHSDSVGFAQMIKTCQVKQPVNNQA